MTRTVYDDLGRTVTTIQNYINGTSSGATADDDLVTRFEYANGLQTRMWVDIDGDNVVDAADQVTTYIYGSVKATPSQSKIATGHLLRAVVSVKLRTFWKRISWGRFVPLPMRSPEGGAAAATRLTPPPSSGPSTPGPS